MLSELHLEIDLIVFVTSYVRPAIYDDNGACLQGLEFHPAAAEQRYRRDFSGSMVWTTGLPGKNSALAEPMKRCDEAADALGTVAARAGARAKLILVVTGERWGCFADDERAVRRL